MSQAPTEDRTASGSAASVPAPGAKPRVWALATAGVVAAATIALALIPAARVAYEAPSLDAMLETTGDLMALLATYLVVGRFRMSRRLDDLLLACGLGALFASGLLFHILAASEPDTEHLPPWTGQLLGALLLAGAAFAPGTRLRPARRISLLLFGAGGVLLASGFALVAGSGVLSRAQASGQPLLVAGALVSTALFAAAAVGFARRVARTNDELFCWFWIGCVLASAAALYGLLARAEYARWISADDLAQLFADLVLLVGAAREIRRYREGLAAVAVLEERHRIARDFHDGLAQELAYILRRAKVARSAVDREVAAAAERAVTDARSAIAALTRPLDASLDVALIETVETVADRHGQKVLLDLEPNVRVDPRTRDELARIAGEAVANAARHGRAPTVWLELSNGGRITMRIADDGVGFEPSGIDRRRQFGIAGMAERARALDADFRLTSVPGRGTEIEVTLP